MILTLYVATESTRCGDDLASGLSDTSAAASRAGFAASALRRAAALSPFVLYLFIFQKPQRFSGMF